MLLTPCAKNISSASVKWPQAITPQKHAYIILTPLNPALYSKTRVYKGIHYFILFLLKNIDYGYSLEPPHRGGSNEYPQSMFWAEIWKISEIFIWKFSFFFVVKFSVCLNRRVFVICDWAMWENGLCVPGKRTNAQLRKNGHIITKTCLFKYTKNFIFKNWKFSDKKLRYFSYFCSKYRLWVLVRTASARRF